MKPALILLFTAIPMIVGCASRTDFPSLALRPYEGGTKLTPTAATPAVQQPASDAARLARIAGAVDRAEAGEAAFAEALAIARAAAQNAGDVGSDSWVAAQLALTRAERTRAPVQIALAELDGELREVLTGPSEAERTALEAALVRVSAMDAQQNTALVDIARRLAQR